MLHSQQMMKGEFISMADSDVSKVVAQKKGRIPYDYALTIGEIMQLYHASEKDIVSALILAFDFGFIKGTRAKGRKKVPVL